MSFFKKMLSKVGIGAAKVDTEIFTEELIPGEEISGRIYVQGGDVEQSIDSIILKLRTSYAEEVKIEDEEGEVKEVDVTKTAVLLEMTLSESFTLEPEQEVVFDLNFTLPLNTPASLGKTRTWLSTELDIKGAIDPGDRDYLEISPHPLVHAFLMAADDLGFLLSEVSCEPSSSLFSEYPFVQEYELKPVSGSYHGRFYELECVFLILSEGQAVQVFMEIDRKFKGAAASFLESIDANEIMVKFTLHPDDMDRLPEILTDILDDNL